MHCTWCIACNRECGWLALTDNGALQGTTTGDKNEILWQHGINYQSLPEQFKKVSFWMPECVSVHAMCMPCDTSAMACNFKFRHTICSAMLCWCAIWQTLLGASAGHCDHQAQASTSSEAKIRWNACWAHGYDTCAITHWHHCRCFLGSKYRHPAVSQKLVGTELHSCKYCTLPLKAACTFLFIFITDMHQTHVVSIFGSSFADWFKNCQFWKLLKTGARTPSPTRVSRNTEFSHSWQTGSSWNHGIHTV